jgi:uncharacterized membrane-anchored protein YhcB (DUF1043 family)
MKLSMETYNTIVEHLSEKANNLPPESEERKEIEIALDEISAIGTY